MLTAETDALSIAYEAGGPPDGRVILLLHGWPDDATTVMQGMSTREWSAYLAEVVGVPGSAASIALRVIDLMAERYQASLPLLPGAIEAVTRLGARWPLGLASSSPRRRSGAGCRRTACG